MKTEIKTKTKKKQIENEVGNISVKISSNKSRKHEKLQINIVKRYGTYRPP